MACKLGGGDGRSVDFELSLWLPTKVEVKNVVFGTYPPDVDQEWVEV